MLFSLWSETHQNNKFMLFCFMSFKSESNPLVSIRSTYKRYQLLQPTLPPFPRTHIPQHTPFSLLSVRCWLLNHPHGSKLQTRPCVSDWKLDAVAPRSDVSFQTGSWLLRNDLSFQTQKPMVSLHAGEQQKHFKNPSKIIHNI